MAHGHGCDSEGGNFEGPAPMDRAHVGPVSRLCRRPKSGRSEFNDPGAIIRV
jgi:hypothetical protein